ncbi:MAG: hypothetical protein B6227_02785 [Fusobacteriia bacterium 4572_74]|nr:MAG: hypothetical protein B6227_02785 [Fusobacteriia bacterium 4572_74]
MTKTEKALENFGNYNCCQVIINAFAEELNLNMDTALKISSGFGGGMTKAEVCGAVSGACMAISLKHGSADWENLESKEKVKKSVNKFMNEFIEKHGSCTCKGLLGYDKSTEEGAKIIKEKELGEKLCPGFIESAIKIAEDII